MKSFMFAIVLMFAGLTTVGAQPPSSAQPPRKIDDPSGTQVDLGQTTGPIKDVTYQVVWLIESDDTNRKPYEGPASEGLQAAGYGRLVTAGSATAAVTIGQRSSVSGASRYGHMTVLSSFLNTTEHGELQVKIELRTQKQSPLSIETTMRAPLNRWFLVGSADSRVGLPKHVPDGKRGLAIMKVSEGVMLLDAQ